MRRSFLAFVTVASLALPAQAAPGACGLPRFGRDLAVLPRPTRAPAPPADGVLAIRDAWGSYPHEKVGERFVIKWGNNGAVTQSDVDALMAAFDRGWEAQVDRMGHAAPDGTDAYYFNVYIGDTGSGTPPGYGAGGYYYRDPDGYPYIVIARNSLYYPEYVEAAAVHELYHAIQDKAAAYTYDGADAWYWEATAEWASGQVLQDNPSYFQFLYGFAYNTQLSVEFFDYPDEGLLTEYHQYGAFVFPRYVSEHALDEAAVVRTWTAPAADTPLGSLRVELQAGGLSLADVFGDFAARNAAWDYEDGGGYAQNVEAADAYWPGEDHVIDDIGPSGTNGPWTPDPADLPRQWGYNVVGVRTAVRAADVRIAVDAAGSAGSPADWRLSLVTEDADGAVTITALTSDGGVASAEVPASTSAYVVAAAVPDSADEGETFAWSLEVTPREVQDTGAVVDDEDPQEGQEPGGCGCGTGGAMSGALLVGLVSLGVVRRKRSR